MEPPRVNEVLNMITSLNLNKSVGHDNLSPYLPRVASTILAPALCCFIDNAFRLDIFPQSCKTDKIVPVFKSGNTQSFTNYRPISILTCFAKIFEKLIFRRLSTFFRKHSVLTKTKYGFQSDKSTSHAILDVLTVMTASTIIYNAGLILLDFKKAFDTVYHPLLLHKLEHCVIRGIAYKLITSFLSNRYQYVAHQNFRSKLCINHFGVPQGSTLGPLLFLIFVNDLPNALSSTPCLFADDTCLVIHATNPIILSGKMNLELQKIYEWTKANNITVNPEKSHVLIIPPKTTHKIPSVKVYMYKSPLKVKDSVKYLGVTIDSRLNFDDHINLLCGKISRSIGVLSKLWYVLPFKLYKICITL